MLPKEGKVVRWSEGERDFLHTTLPQVLLSKFLLSNDAQGW